MSAYVGRLADVHGDRETILGIWRGSLGREAHLASKYEWFYLGCPWGEPMVQLLRHEPTNAWVGVSSAGPRRMVWNGRELRAGVLVDFAVTQEHRSLGPALTLQKALLAAGKQRFELLYGFPNPKAVPVFKRVGCKQLGELVRYACVLRHRTYVERELQERNLTPLLARPASAVLDLVSRVRALPYGRWKARWSSVVDPRMDTLWASSDHGRGPISVRDTTALRWRFDRRAVPETQFLLLSDRHDDLHAWFACQSETNGTLQVCDYWSRDAVRGIDRSYVEGLLRAARHRRHTNVSFAFCGPKERMAGFLEAGFVERSRRPIFGVSTGEPSVEDLHLTAADEDE